ncbi:MAG: M16 family metallopeptidase [Woeseiaceae bacterium]
MTSCRSVRTRTTVFAALALTGTLAAAAATAQEEASETPPPGTAPKDFVLPEKEMRQLDNGLQVTAVQFGSVPKATISVVIGAGNLNEGTKTWLADLTGDFLLEGTATRSAEEIAREAAAMGGAVGVTVTEDQTTITGDVLTEFTPQMVQLLADITRNPKFPPGELERLRRDRLRVLSVAKTQPDQMSLAAFREAIYGEHPYGRLFPEEGQLETYGIEAVRGFYDGNFGAQRTHVFVAGKFDAADTIGAIEKAFADWKAGPEPLVNIPQPAEDKVVVDVIDRPDASQSDIYLGLPTISPGHEDWIPLQVSNTLLGGFFSSRITRNIREDKGYTYSPFSTLSTRYKDGYWAEVAAVTTEVTGPAIQEIVNEIDNLQENPPPAEELEGVKNYSAGVFVLQNSTRGGIINVLSYLDHHDLPESYLTNYVSNVHSVTPEQVSEIAREYLREEDMTLVVVGDRSQVSEQVAPWIGEKD